MWRRERLLSIFFRMRAATHRAVSEIGVNSLFTMCALYGITHSADR
jgi:hypothetical protein